MTLTAAEVWRKYAIQTVPSSGPNQPAKAEIMAWGTLMEDLRAGGGSLAYASRALLLADLAHAANVTASVYADATPAYNGVYKKSGSSGSGTWTRITDLPGDVIRLTVTGGTGNAIVATATEMPSVPGDKLYLLTPSAANTGPATIAVNGGAAATIKNALGSSLAANSLIADSPVLMTWSVDHYQILISVPVDATGILNDAIAARDAANAYATAAASSASALGNQVHQYDTLAQADAATIPVGVTNVIVKREASGYPLCNAPYVPGTSTGPRAFQEAGGHWWELDVSGGGINPYWCGVKNDAAHNDYAALILTRNIARTANKPVLLPPGFNCYFGTTLELARSWERWIPMAPGCTFNFTGTGRAISFDGITYNPTGNGAFRCVFGLPGMPIFIRGTATCTDLFYRNNCHYSVFCIHGRDCTGAVERADMLLSGTPTGAASGVLTYVEVHVSSTADQFFGPMTVIPAFGSHVSNSAVCTRKYVIEDCAFGVYNVACVRDTWLPGSIESCTDGGVYFNADCSYISVTGVQNENIGTLEPSWRISGNFIKLIGCCGVTTDEAIHTALGLVIDGDNNTLEHCSFDGMTINAGAADNVLRKNSFVGLLAITDSGTRTNRDGNAGLSDYKSFTPGMSSSAGSITAVTGVAGKVKYSGSTALYRIEGTITTNGSGSNAVRFTGLPDQPVEDSYIGGVDAGLTSKGLTGVFSAGTSTLTIRLAGTGLYPGLDGVRFIMQGECQVTG